MPSTNLVIGKQGTGKTTFTKDLMRLSKSQKLIYDPNQEFLEFYDEPFVDFNTFIDKASKATNAYIHIEEATIFFSPRARVNEMIDLLVRKRHMKNDIQLNFHSFSSVPVYIKDLIDFVTIFKTNDNEDAVRKRFDKDKIVDAWNRVNKDSNYHAHITLKND